MHDHSPTTFDLKYLDGTVEKRVPLTVKLVPRKISHIAGPAEGLRSLNLPTVQLIRAGLPDTAMSLLPLGSSVGACSEKLQTAVLDYMKTNPDDILTAKTTSTTLTAKALQLLVRRTRKLHVASAPFHRCMHTHYHKLIGCVLAFLVISSDHHFLMIIPSLHALSLYLQINMIHSAESES
jgi:hypothetical protein